MRIKSTPLTWYTILLIITAILTVFVPASPSVLQTLHTSEEVYRVLIITLLVPYAIIWFSAFYGYDQLAKYSQALIFTGEGKAFRKIANGLGVLAWGLILQALSSLVLNSITHAHPGFDAMETFINHYFGLLIALIAFLTIESGTYALAQLVHAHYSHSVYRWLVIIGAAVGALFQRVVFLNQVSGRNPYHLSAVPLIFTIIVPYVFTWIMGVISVYELALYAATVKGLLYKHALQFLANGISVVILLSVVTQFISAAVISPKNNASFGTILLMVYVLFAAIALGFVLVAIGSRRLKRIEEV